MLRGTATGLEFVFVGGGAFDEAATTVQERLVERPDFYRGSAATIVFEGQPPDGVAFTAFVDAVRILGIEMRGVYGPGVFADFAEQHALPYLGVRISEDARSLDADFAGARADLARNRKDRLRSSLVSSGPIVTPVFADTMYHRGTLRGGQSLQHVGNIVLVGDVNPGAELMAGGDVVIFGALLGMAHAGAQGDVGARVIALCLMPTQLRIATSIAVDDTGRRPSEPEVAYVENDRIVIAPLKAGSQ